jgi:hypothetical protein
LLSCDCCMQTGLCHRTPAVDNGTHDTAEVPALPNCAQPQMDVRLREVARVKWPAWIERSGADGEQPLDNPGLEAETAAALCASQPGEQTVHDWRANDQVGDVGGWHSKRSILRSARRHRPSSCAARCANAHLICALALLSLSSSCSYRCAVCAPHSSGTSCCLGRGRLVHTVGQQHVATGGRSAQEDRHKAKQSICRRGTMPPLCTNKL